MLFRSDDVDTARQDTWVCLQGLKTPGLNKEIQTRGRGFVYFSTGTKIRRRKQMHCVSMEFVVSKENIGVYMMDVKQMCGKKGSMLENLC